jgi:hypothetical protein
MTVYRKTNGGWAAASNGNVRIKWGGNWQTASYVYQKVNGQWQDSGYRGYPNPPQGIWVHAWSFSAVALGFSGPAPGGAPVSYYHLVQTDSNGNWINQANVGGSPWGNFGVGEDGYYQFYVRSVAASGLASAFVGPVRVRIGHSEQGYWATENRTQGWSSEHLSGARNKDEPFWVGFGSDVVIQGMHWRNLRTPMSSVVTPGTNRTVNYIFNGGDFGAMNGEWGTIYSGHNGDKGLGNEGTGQPWGIVARGAGWSTTGNGTYMLWCDDFWCDGYQTYQVNVYYVTRYYQDNGYW